MENLDFSEDEIQEQLAALGFTNITKQRLQEFKRDLDLLIRHEKSKSSISAECTSPRSHCSSSTSPPAFTKEKVLLSSAGSSYDNRPSHHPRQFLTSTFNKENHDNYSNRGQVDSYVTHSVATRYIRPSTAPNKLEIEEASSDISYDATRRNIDYINMTSRQPIKRKVLRKHRGYSEVCDETSYSEDSEPLNKLEERLERIKLSEPVQQESFSDIETSRYEESHSSTTEDLPSAFQAYIKGMTRSESDSDIRPRQKSFIRPVMDHPHTRNLKKTDPVAKFFQYKQYWDMFKAPGEKSRKELRLAIREQLMYQPPPPKPQRVYVPNTYVVPTEKKRSALRWEIRHDLANGIVPAKITFP